MQASTRGVILVGHGGIPKDCPGDYVMNLKRLEGQRRQSGQPISVEEAEWDRRSVSGRGTRQLIPIKPAFRRWLRNCGPC